MTNASKTRNFSIYLLKDGFSISDALKKDSKLKKVDADNLPKGGELYVLDRMPIPPWWHAYWGINQDLKQCLKSAVLLLPVKKRCFALTFGTAFHELSPLAYEYDFGLKVTLNSVDPEKIKSTDSVSPSSSLRQRNQLPNATELTHFDFDSDQDVIRSLTGKTQKEYEGLFKQATGAASLRVGLKKNPDELVSVCTKLLDLYNKNDFESTFPNIQNLKPVRDPKRIADLNKELLKAIQAKDSKLLLGLPDIVDLAHILGFKFTGLGKSKLYHQGTIDDFFDYFKKRSQKKTTLAIDELKKYNLVLSTEDELYDARYPFYRCLLFDVCLKTGSTYYLSDGEWYQVKDGFVESIESEIDPIFVDAKLPPYIDDHKNEGGYNKDTAKKLGYVCMDAKSISPNTNVEPCDFFGFDGRESRFFHIKRHTRSSGLSHLFNQGANSIELFKSVEEAQSKFFKHYGKCSTAEKKAMVNGPHEVIYGITTHKDKTQKSKNLPLFSKVSLRRALRALKAMSVKVSCTYIEDQT